MIDKILEYICIFLALIVVLPAHEFAHAFTAVKSGDLTPKLNNRYTLNPLAHFDPLGLACFVFAGFGWAKPVPVNPNNFKNYKWCSFWVSTAGVSANYIISFLAFPLYFLSLSIPQFGYFTLVLQDTLYYIFAFGLVFFVFNLLPINPLDGFRAIDCFAKRRGKFYNFLKFKGIYILYALFFLSILADLTDIFYLDILGLFINFIVGYLQIPIFWFWGLIF